MHFFNFKYQFFREFDEDILKQVWNSWEAGYEKFRGMIVQFIVLKVRAGCQVDQELATELKLQIIEKIQDRAAYEDPASSHGQFLAMLATRIIDELWEAHGEFATEEEINKLVWNS